MLLFVLYTLLVIVSFLSPKSKPLTIITTLFLWAMYGFAWYEGDLAVYQWVYTDLSTGELNTAYEPLFMLSMWIGNKLGLSFTFYRLLLGGFICFGMYSIINRMTDNTAIAIALYGVFPFFIYISVMRTGVASVIVLMALSELIRMEANKKKYVLLIILATLCHYSSIIFMLLLITPEKVKKKHVMVFFAGALILSILILKTDIVYNFVARFTSRQKILQWFSSNEGSANFTGILAEIVLLSSIFFLTYRNKKKGFCVDAISAFTSRMANVKLNDIAYRLACLMLLLLPLIIIASPFMRLPYMVFPVFITSTLNNRENESIRKRFGQINIKISLKASWIVLLMVLLLWKFYYMLPYMKAGASLFTEFFDVQFLL